MVITIVVVAVVVIVIAAVVGYFLERRRRQRELRQRFGGEYDRVVGNAGDRRQGERELLSREKRHEQLDIRPLSPQRAEDYRRGWEDVQRLFVDDPVGAVRDADALVQTVMSERGYPIGDFDTQVADLSVEHADLLQHYRAAHRIATSVEDRDPDTEALRRAMVHYRALFTALLDRGVEQGVEQEADAHMGSDAHTGRRTT